MNFYYLIFSYLFVLGFISSCFFYLDPEFFLFFSALLIFLALSYNINSYLEESIKIRYDLYKNKLAFLQVNLEEIENYSCELSFYLEYLERFLILILTNSEEISKEYCDFFYLDNFLETQINTKYLDLLNSFFSLESQFFLSIEVIELNHSLNDFFLNCLSENNLSSWSSRSIEDINWKSN
jgi:hypothetical protein